MVWYVPPLSPIQSAAEAGKVEFDGVMPKIESLRIPVKYLANMLTAGEEAPVVLALKRLMAMRLYMRGKHVDGQANTEVLEEVDLTAAQVEEMYRYLAIANYEDRFVIPTSHREMATEAFPERGGCGFSFGDGCHGDSSESLFGGRKTTTTLVQPVETFDPGTQGTSRSKEVRHG